ncbi:Neutral ceramidase 3 [Salvia divinorum]|uniref:Neutral ceramidase 3 n=1 Tax=Salvia divinorum TaxID=28513 RepID=A0ABD1H2C7_SALDI
MYNRGSLSLVFFISWLVFANGDYLVGVGSHDMTCPVAGVNLMGYANMEQVTGGIHFRLRARTFVVAQGGSRIAFVNLDARMASQLVTIKVLQRLKSRYEELYNEENVAISRTHTHAGPGGYLQYVTYSITSLGFIPQSFDALVTAIELSIVRSRQSQARFNFNQHR